MAGKYFGIPFALSGDRSSIPDAAQPDGSVSFTQGFTLDYELENTDPNYKPVPREETNALYYDITEAIGIVQKQGFADWTSDAAPYPQSAFVRHIGFVWVSAIPANSATPGDNASWSKFDDLISKTPTRSVFTASGTWNKPAGMKFAFIRLVGGGGGGGGSAGAGTGGSSASGGAAGGYREAFVAASVFGASETVTIGAAGTGGVGSLANGVAGGTTSFGSHMSATGGGGGGGSANTAVITRGAQAAGSGGTSSGLGVGRVGQTGQVGMIFGSTNTAVGGNGASGPMGTGGSGRNEGSNGLIASGFGAGGAGAASSTLNQNGGDGSPGVVEIWEYY